MYRESNKREFPNWSHSLSTCNTVIAHILAPHQVSICTENPTKGNFQTGHALSVPAIQSAPTSLNHIRATTAPTCQNVQLSTSHIWHSVPTHWNHSAVEVSR